MKKKIKMSSLKKSVTFLAYFFTVFSFSLLMFIINLVKTILYGVL